MKKIALLSTSLLVSFGLAACGADDDDEEDATGRGRDEPSAAVARTGPAAEESVRPPSGGARASAPTTSSPSIRIVNPSDGQAVDGSAVTVSVSVKGVRIVGQHPRPPFPPPVAGEGHVHFYLDTKTLPTTHSPPATGVYRSVSGTTYTWTGVGPGRHSFAVQLVGKDHAPLSPPVKDRITVE